MAAVLPRSTDRFAIPVGKGGTLAHIGRMVIMVLTFGFVFPNAFVEGLNLTDIDNSYSAKVGSQQK